MNEALSFRSPEKNSEKKEYSRSDVPKELANKLDHWRLSENVDIMMKTMDLIVEFTDGLKAKHGEDCMDCLLYHFLVGSTPKGMVAIYDFPGEDSVEKFIDALPQRLEEKAV